MGVACPRDGAAMDELAERSKSGEVLIDLCPECAGLWLDGGEVAKLTGQRNLESFLASLQGMEAAMTCPRCASGVVAKRFRELEVDVCSVCGGAWFDASELESLQIAYLKHLDEARVAALGEVDEDIRKEGMGSLVYWAMVTFIRARRRAEDGGKGSAAGGI